MPTKAKPKKSATASNVEPEAKGFEIRVAELFAGVGGFRLGLERVSKEIFHTVFSSQWEPGSRKQYASELYIERFGPDGHSNEDISLVLSESIPRHDLLVGGFPCQDYSVAKTLSQSSGIAGKKGVLWWQIHRIIADKKDDCPKYLLLENVDRLLKSPASQRGRDFAIMLASLSDLGYAVEWRVINAAEYGMPQRRRRVFFFAFHRTTNLFKELMNSQSKQTWMLDDGVLANAFPCVCGDVPSAIPSVLDGDLAELTETFNRDNKLRLPFPNAGLMFDRQYWTNEVRPQFGGVGQTLGDVLQDESVVGEEYFIDDADVPKWMYQKGSKTIERISKEHGHSYVYSEGSMAFPDPLDKPGRTIITGEGGSTPSRFKHVVRTRSGRYRRLTPIELERLNMFPDDHTAGIPNVKRAFLMGNALVVGIVSRIASELLDRISHET